MLYEVITDENTAASDSDTATVGYADVAPSIDIQKTVDVDADTDSLFSESESISEGGVGTQTADYRYVLTHHSEAGTSSYNFV